MVSSPKNYEFCHYLQLSCGYLHTVDWQHTVWWTKAKGYNIILCYISNLIKLYNNNIQIFSICAALEYNFAGVNTSKHITGIV